MSCSFFCLSTLLASFHFISITAVNFCFVRGYVHEAFSRTLTRKHVRMSLKSLLQFSFIHNIRSLIYKVVFFLPLSSFYMDVNLFQKWNLALQYSLFYFKFKVLKHETKNLKLSKHLWPDYVLLSHLCFLCENMLVFLKRLPQCMLHFLKLITTLCNMQIPVW